MLGEKLKEIRLNNKMTQEELAEKVNVSRPMISQIERGTKSLSLLLSQELAQALNCSIEDFLK